MRALAWTLLLIGCSGDKDDPTDDTAEVDTPAETADTDVVDDTVDTPAETVDTDAVDTPSDTVDTPSDTVDTPSDTNLDTVDDTVTDTVEDTVTELTCADGVAWFTDAAGVTTELSTLFTSFGAAQSPVWTAPGDGELVLCAGTFHARVVAQGTRLTVRGAGVDQTVLDTRGAGTSLSAQGAGSVVAEGFTMQGGVYGGAGAAYVDGGSSLTLRDLDIDHATGNCDFYVSCAAAIYGSGGPAAVTVERVNVRESDGFLSVLGGATALTVTDVTVSDLRVGLGELSAVGTISGLDVSRAPMGFGLSGTVQLSVEDSRFLAMGASNGPAVFFNAGNIQSPSRIDLTDVEIGDGQIQVSNIWLDEVSLTRVNVHDLDVGAGSAVMVGSPLQITDSTFARITTTGTGAAVYHSGYDGVIRGSTFTDNHADSNGGALWLNGWTTLLDDCTFSRNTSGARGGAVWIPYTTVLTATGSSFLGNEATDGGAIAAENPPGSPAPQLTLTDVLLSGNAATQDGGGLWANRFTVTTVDVTARGNYAGRDGGAMRFGYVSSHTNLTAEDNTADGEGGALAAANNMTLASSTLLRNTATTAGAVAWWIQLDAQSTDFGAGADDNLPYDLWDRSNAPRSPQSVDGVYTGLCAGMGCPMP